MTMNEDLQVRHLDLVNQGSRIKDLIGKLCENNEKLRLLNSDLSALASRLWITVILQVLILIVLLIILWFVKTKVIILATDVRRLAQLLGISPNDYGQILQEGNNALVEEPEEIMGQLEREVEGLQQDVVELRRRLVGRIQPPVARAG